MSWITYIHHKTKPNIVYDWWDLLYVDTDLSIGICIVNQASLIVVLCEVVPAGQRAVGLVVALGTLTEFGLSVEEMTTV